MKISLSVFEDCVFEYINREIVAKLSDWRKWAIPVAAGMAKPAMDNYFKKYEEILKTANIVDSSNMIDVDLLYDNFHKVAESTGDIVQSIPLIGEVKFSARDVEQLYRIIQSTDKPSSSSIYGKG